MSISPTRAAVLDMHQEGVLDAAIYSLELRLDETGFPVPSLAQWRDNVGRGAARGWSQSIRS